MSLRGRLSQASNYLRELRRSRDPDSYAHYKRGRRHERDQTDRARERATAGAERAREKAERASEYGERYAREGEGDIAPERADQTEESDR